MKDFAYAGRSLHYAPSYARGTRRFRRHVRREPHNAIACDAMCDVHSGLRDRLRSRSLLHSEAAREITIGVEQRAIERSDAIILAIFPVAA